MTTAYRTCPFCEATCGLAITLDGDRVEQVRGDAEDVFSKGFLCPKGVALKAFHEDPARLRAPLVKQPGGAFAEATWDEAFALIAERLPAIQAAHGRDAVGAYIGNPSVHSLDGQVYGRVLLKALQTKNVFSASTVDQYPKQAAAAHMFGGGLVVPVPDLDRTDYLLMLGANPAASNGSLMTAPDVRGRLAAIRARGGRVVVVDPRRTRSAKLAGEHLWIRPGADALFLFALVHVLVAEGLTAPGEHLAGVEVVEGHAADFSPEAVEPATGVPAETTRRIARELAAAPRAAVYGRIGTTTQAFGTTASWLVDVVNALTGNLDRPGGAMFALPATSKRGTGTGRGARFGRWTSRVRGAPEIFGELPVACLAEEIETPGDGRIRAMITVAGNPIVSTPNSERLRAAFDSLDFMVSVDVYLNETTRRADVILPAPSHLERPHYDLALYGFAVRNVANYSPPVLEKPAGTPDEWETLLRLAAIAGGAGPDADVAALDDMVAADAAARAGVEPDPARRGPARVVDAMLRGGPYGLSLADLEAAPHGIDLGPLEPRLPEVLRTPSGRVELAPPALVADVDRLHAAMTAPANGGMVLIGRRHLRSNNSWMNALGPLAKGPNRCTALVNPADAERLGVADGDTVRVRSRTGAIELPAELTDDLMPGVVSIPHGWEHANSNVLADEQLVEPLTGTAILNGIPVELTPA
jgi:anaerobic selenocysteine-containing dehydrogenase